MPEVSIVVPVYKVEQYLKRCVDSILAQTYTDYQLILVDDGSPDNCGMICDEYAKKDSRIHVIHRENGGLSAARNSGIDWVFDGHLTEWITFIDSDDWVHPSYLEYLLAANLKNNTNVSLCGYMLSYDDSQYSKSKGESKLAIPEEFWVEKRGDATVAWGKLYKTILFNEIRYPNGKLNEDEYTTFRLLFQQAMISVISDELYMYYQASVSIMRSKWTVKRMDLLGGYIEQLLYFKSNGFRKAFKESKKNFVFSIQNNISEIKKSDDEKSNMRIMIKIIKSYLYRRYNSKLLSSELLCRLYIKKLIVEQCVSIRLNVLKRVLDEEGAKGVKKKLLREQDD